MAIFIDRRLNDKNKSSDNRHRFLRKVKAQVKESMKKVIASGPVKSISDGKAKKIKIPGKGLDQPFFTHQRNGGLKHFVVPGNKEYVAGDRIQRPDEGDGHGTGGSPDGESEDGFQFELTQEEFEELFFEDLELPFLDKRTVTKSDSFTRRRAGFSPDGTAMNIIRSMKGARGRRVSLRSKKKKKLAELQIEYADLQQQPILSEDEEKRLRAIEREMEKLRDKIKRVPFITDEDIRYNRWEITRNPTANAVMFCTMDVSGSMGAKEKDLAKRFFMTLYHFLQRSYDKVDIVYIRHTQIANEVDEDEFFFSTHSGGTIVSSGLNMVGDIIKERYPLDKWNIYVSQASDGENWPNDSAYCVDLLNDTLLKLCQFYAYVQVTTRQYNHKDADLWRAYSSIVNNHENFDMAVIREAQDIWPVFQKLFEKRGN